MTKEQEDILSKQIRLNKKLCDYDVKEYSIEYYINKFLNKEYFKYSILDQNEWTDYHQSSFIENVILDLPMLPFYMKDSYNENRGTTIIDGVQRLRTLTRFINNNKEISGFENSLILEDMEILDELEGLSFLDLSKYWQKKIMNKTIRMYYFDEDTSVDIISNIIEYTN